MKESSEPSTLPPRAEAPADPRVDEPAGDAAAARREPPSASWSAEPMTAREADNWEG